MLLCKLILLMLIQYKLTPLLKPLSTNVSHNILRPCPEALILGRILGLSSAAVSSFLNKCLFPLSLFLSLFSLYLQTVNIRRKAK